MADGDFFEDFNVDDKDLENALNPGGRKYRRQTKEQATYGRNFSKYIFTVNFFHVLGVWADSDSEDERPSFSSRKKPKYTEPVSFVSGGIKNGNKIENSDGTVLEEEQESETIEPEYFKLPKASFKQQKKVGTQEFAGMRSASASAASSAASIPWSKNSGSTVKIMNMMQVC